MADHTVSLHLTEGCAFPVSEEDALIAGLRGRAEVAYETLILLYQQPIYNLIYRLMNDRSDACDVVQEVFLKVFRNIGSFRGGSSLKTWVYRIAVNEAHNHRRWFSRHQKKEIALAGDESSPSYEDCLADPGRSPFEVAADHETRALIEAALAELNPKFCEAVVLRDITEMSYEEIAEVLDISLGTVKSRILRGREALRKALEGRLEPDTAMHWSPQPAE